MALGLGTAHLSRRPEAGDPGLLVESQRLCIYFGGNVKDVQNMVLVPQPHGVVGLRMLHQNL